MTRTFTEPRPPFGPERCQSNVGYQIKQHEHIVHLKEKKKERKKKKKEKKGNQSNHGPTFVLSCHKGALLTSPFISEHFNE